LLHPKLIVVILLLGISVSCTRQNTQNNVPASTNNPGTEAGQPRNSIDVVKVSALPAEINRNGTADAVVQLNIQSGYHVNANPPTFPYLKATELELAQTRGISVNFIVYPDAITKSFAFADKPLAVYEGTTDIKVNLKADKSAQPGGQSLSGKLRVQACDEQVCYAPGTLDVSIPLNIK
jgi:Thiol:disulfide interchange protein DsbD, N-terminal